MKNQALIPNKDGAPGDISEDLTALAADLAKELVPPQQVARAYGLNDAEFHAILASPEFAGLLEVEQAKWNAAGNTNKRLMAKAQMAVEQTTLDMVDIVKDREVGAQARIKAFAELVRISATDNAGIARAAASSGAGLGNTDRFSIAIHIGGRDDIIVGGDDDDDDDDDDVVIESDDIVETVAIW